MPFPSPLKEELGKSLFYGCPPLSHDQCVYKLTDEPCLGSSCTFLSSLRLAAGLDSFTKVKHYVSRFATVAAQRGTTHIVTSAASLPTVHQYHQVVCRLADALREVAAGRSNYARAVEGGNVSVLSSSTSAIAQQASDVQTSRDGLDRLLKDLKKTQAILLLSGMSLPIGIIFGVCPIKPVH